MISNQKMMEVIINQKSVKKQRVTVYSENIYQSHII